MLKSFTGDKISEIRRLLTSDRYNSLICVGCYPSMSSVDHCPMAIVMYMLLVKSKQAAISVLRGADVNFVIDSLCVS